MSIWSIFRRCAKLVVVWFALATVAAVASPLINPKRMAIVCVGTGGAQLVVIDDGGKTTPMGSHSLDCPSCLLAAPPPALWLHAREPQSRFHYLVSHYRTAHIAAFSGSALPPRGPPQVVFTAI
ncbi:DUF2946 domain-containing protein [Lampropedia aestuarii]|uniref:DUF2946 domain-containing protein n=1 Tax=Lampropedia aestuarii TaxID=2562762 RepID=UPI0024691AC8|nr:DUF2946 domain-containing protein [Lampropedia aestuarii]MDH5857097.1 DUF2946 domain-containing protein [Lampropedia aestuarii]